MKTYFYSYSVSCQHYASNIKESLNLILIAWLQLQTDLTNEEPYTVNDAARQRELGLALSTYLET